MLHPKQYQAEAFKLSLQENGALLLTQGRVTYADGSLALIIAL